MAGIMANSASQTMGSGDTSTDNNVSGYLLNEQITLTVTPSGSSYSWSTAKPGGDTARSDLTASTGASVAFTPTTAGYYVITCLVDGTTTYVIRISCTATAVSTAREAIRLQPKADSEITTPSTGVALYYSSTQNALSIKDSAGNVSTVDITSA